MTQETLPNEVYELIQTGAVTPEAMRLIRASVMSEITTLIYGTNVLALQYFGGILSELSTIQLPVYRLATDGETITTRKMILLYQFPDEDINKEMLLFMARHYRVRLLIHFEQRDNGHYEVVEISQRAAPTSDSVINLAASNHIQTLYERYQPSNILRSTGTNLDFEAKINADELNVLLSIFDRPQQADETVTMEIPEAITEAAANEIIATKAEQTEGVASDVIGSVTQSKISGEKTSADTDLSPTKSDEVVGNSEENNKEE